MFTKTIKSLIAPRLLTALIAGLLLSLSAFAALDKISDVVEIKASSVSMSGNQLVFAECDECNRVRLKLKKEITNYVIKTNGNAETVAQSDFSSALLKLDNRSSLVVVFWDPVTKVVTEIRLSQK